MEEKKVYFYVPYLEFIMLRHNLDVMHIEKNVLHNLAYTLLGDKKKSKNNLSARKDL